MFLTCTFVEVAGAARCRLLCHESFRLLCHESFQPDNVELVLQVIRPQNLSFKLSSQARDLLLQRGYFGLRRLAAFLKGCGFGCLLAFLKPFCEPFSEAFGLGRSSAFGASRAVLGVPADFSLFKSLFLRERNFEKYLLKPKFILLFRSRTSDADPTATVTP